MKRVNEDLPHEEGSASVNQLPEQRSRLKDGLFMALYALSAGLVASLSAIVVMTLLRLLAGIPTPVELFGDRVLKIMDAGTFVRFQITFGSNSKTGPLGLALLGMLALGTLLGLLYALLAKVSFPTRSNQPQRREWLTATGIALGMTLLAVILFWTELRQNFLGLPVDTSRIVTIVGLMAVFAVYGVVLCLTYHLLLPHQIVAGADVQAQRRRQVLRRTGVAVLGLGAGAGAWQLARSYTERFTTYDGMQTHPINHITAPITPNDQHYVVTQNPIDPTPNIDVWRLDVAGLVGQGGTYTYEQLQQLPSTSRPITLECIANGPNSGLMSTAIWHGVTLKTLLDKHGGAQAAAQFVAFYSVDGYTISLPLKEVLEADALLAWQMNGVTLPNRHGYPLRVLIPGRYGEENPKWLTRVELTDHFVGGLYADQGWYHGPLHTTSRIDHPRGTYAPGTPIEVGGVAFAGNRGIQKVEVSVDGGSTWNTTTLKEPLSSDTWVFWSWPWQPTQAGDYTLTARATDGTGELQTSHKQGTVPNGGTGYQEVKITIK